jgi:hypothetical protein
MCLLERRKTKQHLHDARFGLYERAVTFEGPHVYSESLPIRGGALSGQIQELCGKVLNDVSESAQNKSQKHKCIGANMRMVLNLKVDSRDRIWILYTSSIRLISNDTNHLLEDFPDIGVSPTSSKSMTPLNLHDVITLSPNVRLTQNANHNPDVKVTKTKSIALCCPSCGVMSVGESFYAVPYKTIICHYEKVMEFATKQSKKDCWPPSPAIIKMAGGVGFGTISMAENYNEADTVIPPVIRFLHQHMKAEGYQCYRSDALFLHKKCDVCEDCFLAYAKLVSSSFQFTFPSQQLDDNLEECTHYNDDFPKLENFPRKKDSSSQSISSRTKLQGKSLSSRLKKTKLGEREKLPSSLDCLVTKYPSLPPAIANPQEIKLLKSLSNRNFLPLPYEVIESPDQPLKHLINLHGIIKQVNTKNCTAQDTTRNESIQNSIETFGG